MDDSFDIFLLCRYPIPLEHLHAVIENDSGGIFETPQALQCLLLRFAQSWNTSTGQGSLCSLKMKGFLQGLGICRGQEDGYGVANLTISEEYS